MELSCKTSVIKKTINIRWTIENFNKFQGDSLESSKIVLNHHKLESDWIIEIYPHSEFIEACVNFVDSTILSEIWIKVSLACIDVTNTKRNITFDHEFPNFMQRNDPILMESNNLVIACKLEISRPHEIFTVSPTLNYELTTTVSMDCRRKLSWTLNNFSELAEYKELISKKFEIIFKESVVNCHLNFHSDEDHVYTYLSMSSTVENHSSDVNEPAHVTKTDLPDFKCCLALMTNDIEIIRWFGIEELGDTKKCQVSRTFLMEKVVDNRVTIICDLEFPIDEVHSNLPVIVKPPLEDEIAQLYKNPVLSDLSIMVKGCNKLKVHQTILFLRCPAFYDAIKENILDDVIELDVEFHIFEKFIEFVYTKRVEEIKDVAANLMSFAEKYDVKELISLCHDSIKDW